MSYAHLLSAALAVIMAGLGFVGGVLMTVALSRTASRPRRSGGPQAPFVVASSFQGRPMMFDTCVGAEIGATVHQIAYGELWDRIVVEPNEAP